jgi:lipopolysaccharide export system permease protein
MQVAICIPFVSLVFEIYMKLKLLDWYILKKFLSTFIFVVLILVAIIVVIDFTEKNDDFIKRNAPAGKILFDYYLNYIPYIANLLSPITVFIASVFVTAQLASRTEITAILASGVSFRRLMLPYIIGACLVGSVIFYFTGWVIPNANKVRVDFERQYIKDQFYNSDRNIHRKIAQNTYIYMESYDNIQNVGYRFTTEVIVGTNLKEKLESQRIIWQPEKKKWKLEAWKLRKFNGLHETLTYGIEMDTTLNMLPKDFGSNYLLYETFTLPELERFIGELINRGDDGVATYQVEKYVRFTAPFAILILTLMGVIVSARKSRGGVGFQIAFGFVLAFVYILFFIMSKGLAEVGSINPILAVWLPNIIFSVVGVVMYFTVPR